MKEVITCVTCLRTNNSLWYDAHDFGKGPWDVAVSRLPERTEPVCPSCREEALLSGCEELGPYARNGELWAGGELVGHYLPKWAVNDGARLMIWWDGWSDEPKVLHVTGAALCDRDKIELLDTEMEGFLDD